MRGRIADQLTTIADLKVSQIVNWRNERLGDARLLMQTPSLARSAAAFFANPDSAAASTEILAYISALRNNYRYEAVVLFDQRMNPRLAVPPPAVTTGPGCMRCWRLFLGPATSSCPIFTSEPMGIFIWI